ncbi:phospholipase C gamma-like protein 1 [Sarcoptes scabiei]|uniref:Phosphoinositide phospholipase C n=1 Tax=Sarcoptes scabiei TaxID=52283 RepID=A0A132A8K5_SARSC|nr:phospholipase C gamma-like protein 1 [Sarcoptes scabiei]
MVPWKTEGDKLEAHNKCKVSIELKGGRLEAEKILHNNLAFGDGTFLVRESESHPGDYTLSFLYDSNVHHSRIKSTLVTNDGSMQTYRLNDLMSFNSLFELINYYQSKPLKSEKFQELFLRHAAQQTNTHENQPWFYSNLSKEESEDKLKRLRHNGAFLVRPSEQKGSQFAISFRAESYIKHCRIKKEGRLYLIGNEEFESLTDLIEFYQKNPLYKETRLLFPATEENVRVLGGEPTESPTSYMEHGLETSKFVVLYEYTAKDSRELTLNIGDVVENVVKCDNDWWKGTIESRIGYFPSNFVTEINKNDEEYLNNQRKIELDREKENETETYGSLELDEKITVSLNSIGLNSFKVGPLIFMAETQSDCEDWITKIQEIVNKKAKNKESIKRLLKIAPELNNLIIYCCSVAYEGSSTHFREMCSIKESKIERQLNLMNYRNILNFSRKQLLRVYPEGTRIYSSNYNPISMWNCGVQMVALNYQTKDKPMQLNHAKFMQNGGCGYVLMPKYMNSEQYNPFLKSTSFDEVSPIILTVRIICAKNLRKMIKGILCPLVEVELIGNEFDAKKFNTDIIYDNGLCPKWNDAHFVFNIAHPELSLLRFVVYHRDNFDENSIVGQATFPTSCLRQGIRSIRLRNEYSEYQELGTLLVQIQIQCTKE